MSGNLKHIALDWLLRIRQHPEDAALRTELAAWLAADAAHVEAYRQAERVWQVTGLVQPAGNLGEPIPAATATTPPPRPLRQRRRRWPALLGGALAACLLLFVAPDAWLSYQSDYRTALGQHNTIQLEDGSQVHLDSQSAIAVNFSGNQRQVRLLTGQAFFEVTPDKARPFQVQADDLQVTVTGTAFNVALRPGRLAVAVQHGSVRVTEHDQVLAAALTQRDRLRWSAGGEVQRDRLPVSQIGAWQQGQLVVRDARIAEVLDELRPYLPGRLYLADTELGEQRITGVYNLDDADAALRALLQPTSGQLRIWGNWLRVIERRPQAAPAS